MLTRAHSVCLVTLFICIVLPLVPFKLMAYDGSHLGSDCGEESNKTCLVLVDLPAVGSAPSLITSLTDTMTLPGIPSDFVSWLNERSGLRPLPAVDANTASEQAAEIFNREGIVAIRGALQNEEVQQLRNASRRVMEDIIRHDPDGGGSRGPKRYSFGGSSSTQSQLHHPEWAALVDLPAVTRVLEAIWGSTDYACMKAGGDFCLSGAPGHQNLHADFPQPHLLEQERAPFIAVNFLIEDQTPLNGPLRHIPKTQKKHMRDAPDINSEPEDWLLSTMCPLPAGTAIVRDLRAWHGDTPNLSRFHRAMPNAEFVAPFYVKQAFPLFAVRSMAYEIWEGLSERGQHLARYLRADKGQHVAASVEFDLGLGGEKPFFGGYDLPPLFTPCQDAFI